MAFDLSRQDTICAPATARGRAAIAVVRWSGRAAFAVRDGIFRRRRSGAAPAALAVRGDVVGDDGAVIDDALCTSFPGPHSVTGEDVVELSVHGGTLIQELVLERLVTLGCRVAEPGEFTLRAVLNGVIDLAAGEAVEAVVGARTTQALAAAQRALRGGLSQSLAPGRERLVDALAELEARLDFPDEPLGDANRTALVTSLTQAGAGLRALVAQARRGRRLQDGARVVLWGAPNAGKSTLLNALVGHERALVHHEPGTTRDAIEAWLDVDGVPVVVVDVAGVRDASADASIHAVEAHGIERARAEVSRADVVVLVQPPGGVAPPPLPDGVTDTARVLRVARKCDLVPVDTLMADAAAHAFDVVLSAHSGVGLDRLLVRLAEDLGQDGEAPLVHTARQEQALRDAANAIDDAVVAVADALPDELACSELRRAARAIDTLLGGDVGEDVLNAIFSRFCIGK
jgi:tRNA modification GTPase